MAQFELALLGTPRFSAHGRPVRFATRKAQALLTLLAVEAIPISRDKLVDLLWVDSDANRGRASLRQTLNLLRSGLKASGLKTSGHAAADSHSADLSIDSSADSLIISNPDTIALNLDANCHIDVRLLDRAYDLSRKATIDPLDPQDLLVTLEQASTAYAGDFLDGFSCSDAPNFDDWASAQREKWHLRLGAVLDCLSRLQFEGGEFAAGIVTATRWVAHDALNEIAHRRLMQLHLAAGNRAGALHAYELCRATLIQELNASPSPETEALAERLRTQSIPTALPEATLPSRRPQVLATALIGRADEHHQLIRAYRLAREGQSQAIVIQGEPGIGKTRLAHEFLGWAATQGPVIMRAAAHELALNSPYQVWVDAFRAQVNHDEGRAAWAGLEPAWQHALAQVLPELAGPLAIATDTTTDTEQPQTRSQLFEAAFRFVQRLTQPRQQNAIAVPRILFLDDVQWADATSSDVLQYLVRRCAEEALPILLVMTLREEAAEAVEPTLTALRRHIHIESMRLNALSRVDSERLVHTLIAETFKQTPDAIARHAEQVGVLAQSLFTQTAGQPLYLLETFKSLFESAASASSKEGAPNIEAELASWQQSRQDWLAPGVKDVIGARLRRVSREALTLIQTVAVLDQNTELEVCRQVATLNEPDALEVLDETIRRGLLRESTSGAISFTHDKIREVAYAGLSASRRRSLHRRSAETLEQLYPDRLNDYAPLIAAHFDAATDVRARPYHQHAGDAAARVYAYREAAVHYARAIELAVNEARRLNIDANDRRAELRALIADLHFRLSSMHIQIAAFGAAVETVRRLGELACEWHDPALEHVTRVWLAPNLSLPGPHMELDEAERLAEQILPQARAAHLLHDKAHALRTLMRVALYRTRFDLALRYGQQILEEAKGLGVRSDDVLYGYVLTDLVQIESFRHRFDAAQRYGTEALQFWRALDRPAMVLTTLLQISFIAMCRGDYELALSLSQEGASINEQTHNDLSTRVSSARIGLAYLELGQVDRAIEVTQEAMRLSRLEQQDLTYILTGTDLACIYSRLGRVSEGLEVAQAAYATADLRMKAWRLPVIPSLVQLHVQQAELDQASMWLAQGRALMNAQQTWPAVDIMLDAAEAELALAQDDAAHALALSRACVAACRQGGWRQQLPSMLLLEGRVWHVRGQLDRAMSTLQQAADEARTIHAQWSLQQIMKEKRAIEGFVLAP